MRTEMFHQELVYQVQSAVVSGAKTVRMQVPPGFAPRTLSDSMEAGMVTGADFWDAPQAQRYNDSNDVSSGQEPNLGCCG